MQPDVSPLLDVKTWKPCLQNHHVWFNKVSTRCLCSTKFATKLQLSTNTLSKNKFMCKGPQTQDQERPRRQLEWNNTIFWKLYPRVFHLYGSAPASEVSNFRRVASRGYELQFPIFGSRSMRFGECSIVGKSWSFPPKWVHKVQHGLRQDRAILVWIRIISKPLLTPHRLAQTKRRSKDRFGVAPSVCDKLANFH